MLSKGARALSRQQAQRTVAGRSHTAMELCRVSPVSDCQTRVSNTPGFYPTTGRGCTAAMLQRLQLEVARRLRLVFHCQQDQLERLAAGARPIDLLTDGQTEQRAAHWSQDRYAAFTSADVLGVDQGQVVILAAGFFAAMHARIHGDHARRNFLVPDDESTRQFCLQSLGGRGVLNQTVEQLLKTLHVETGDGN